MSTKIITTSGEVITYNNLLARATERCVYRPKVLHMYVAHADMNIITEKNTRMYTQVIKAGDCIIVDTKHHTVHALSPDEFTDTFDVINNINSTSEC